MIGRVQTDAGDDTMLRRFAVESMSRALRCGNAGVTDSVILWKTEDLGALTVEAAVALVKGTLKPGDTKFKTTTLGEFEIKGDNILLGKPFIFNKDNIDQFDF